MDKRVNNGGGSRLGAGRKKGTGLSGAIKKCVDNLMVEMLNDEFIKEKINKDLIQLSLTDGWIYVIKDNKTNLIKIGITQKENPKQRLSQYLSHNMDIKLLFIDNVNDCFSVEDNIHQRISDKQIKGDWFNLSTEDVLGVFRIISESKYKKCFNGRW